MKRITLSFLLLAVAHLAVTAQPFSPMPAGSYPVTETALPVYTTQFPLGKHHTDFRYSISLLYPEYAPLSKAEAVRARRLLPDAPATPRIDTQLGVSRKEGLLDVSICPIVCRNGQWQRLVNCKIKLDTLPPLHAKAPHIADLSSRYASHSVLASGKWVKIRVSTEGIYELTASRLKSMGFTDISRVRVFGYGGRILPRTFDFSTPERLTDDLEEVATFRRSGSLLFYAEGTLRWTWNDALGTWSREQNHYSRHSYYFLTEGDAPLHVSPLSAAAGGNVVSTAIVPALYEDDRTAWYEGGTEMFDAYDFANGNEHSFRLSTPGLTSAEAQLEVAFSAASTQRATTAFVSVDGESAGSLSVSTYNSDTESARETRSVRSLTLSGETHTVKLTATAGNAARLNYLLASYPRLLSAASAFVFVPATTSGGEACTLSIADATASTQVWQIGRAGEPTAQLEGSLSGSTLAVPVDAPERRLIIVNTAGSYPEPETVGTIDNQDLHADTPQDMVIIIPESGKLLSEAERLAEAHRSQGLRVRIVRADQLYNEFSSGTPDATAYRRYLKMLYDRSQSSDDLPRYLLLFGDCYWDNRFITAPSSMQQRDYLLAFEVSTSNQLTNIPHGTLYSYVTDDYFGLLDDGEGAAITSRDKVDVGIGRFLCHDAATARTLVDKTLDYLDNNTVGSWKNRIVMLADYGDNCLHMNDCEETVSTILDTDPQLAVRKYYWDAYTYTPTATGLTFPQVTKMLQDELKRGALIFNYTGHGSPNQLSHAKLLTAADFEAPTMGNMPLWIFASCEITPYDQSTTDIGRSALYSSTGAVAVVCASRSVYATYNCALNKAYCQQVLSRTADGHRQTLGDAMRLAKVQLLSGGSGDPTMNKLKYVLLGDPALKLAAPEASVVLDSINGAPVTGSVQLRAGEKVRFSGHVEADGTFGSSFTGTLTGTLYDREETITCKNNSGDDRVMVYKDRTKSLCESSDSVVNGKFELNMVVPRDISYTDDPGRIYFYAVNRTHTLECHGYDERFHLNGSATTEADTIGPRAYVYLNAPDFPDGGFVAPDCLFGAVVTDSAGINTSGIAIGHDMELILDDDVSGTIVLNDYFAYDFGSTSGGTVTYPLTGLSEGRHRLTFRVWDINDNATTTHLTFNVKAGAASAFAVNATQNPALTSTTFVTTLPVTDADCRVSVEVYDMTGRQIWTSTQTAAAGSSYAAATWNLADRGGHPVGAGIYLYRTVVASASGTNETKARRLIVLRR